MKNKDKRGNVKFEDYDSYIEIQGEIMYKHMYWDYLSKVVSQYKGKDNNSGKRIVTTTKGN